ncbi:hypothetical protein [Tuwongella immobilis]|uniref:Uncharacterized protein n=1 Tax=Tuwongella immobilis TaxID=692036 RepID=A0A6C2YU34_9BACT|nr:hypothetical protein [Tuwongella immobilis]VIP04392.1 Uncharacterized protein OS=Planctomyces limnophilus (strain ATCC 43296 / DSM 3776 / IFAM 1008 / 290) GN=Plim_1099 PE=4 SV=1 [Tuwongella immobilis]VTS06146.1 Uncharacterized protein OS=Planctomyces limnophilus (strain ATCC 43296 / DSM 3776 / IFAM 1008 / 290) GN=Plim_1099 PE=4 SV=1 [Tuwongella immobilis]
MKKGVNSGSRKGFAICYFRERRFSNERLIELAEKSVPFQRRLLEQIKFASTSLVGNPFPKTWEAMRAPRLENVLGTPDLAIPWSIAKITANRDRLNPALQLRRKMEHVLIEGRPAECEDLIEEFEKGWGCSLWSLDLRFVAAQFARGFHGNRTVLNYFADSCSNEWIHLLAQNSSFRALLNISTREYLETVGVMIPQLGSDELSSYVLDYVKYRLNDDIPSTETGIANVLHFESRHAMIDLYDTAVKILSRTLRGTSGRNVRDAVRHLARDISGDRLAGLAAVATERIEGECHEGRALYDCLERLSQGDYAGCLASGLGELRQDPTELIWFDLVATAAVGCRSVCPLVFPVEAPGQLVLSGLYDWYSARTFRRQSIEELRRLSRALRPTHLGAALAEFVALFDQQQSALGRDCIGLLACSWPIPQFAYGYVNADRARGYLNRLNETIGRTAGGEVVANYHRLLDDPKGEAMYDLPEPEVLRFRAAAFHSHGQWQEVADSLRRLREIAPEYSRARPELLVCEAEALLGMRELDRAATVLGELFCEDRKLLPPLLLRRMAVILKDEKFRPSATNIAWPILAAAAQKDDRAQISLDRVHDFVGDYIESQGATKPTELTKYEDSLPIELIVFLAECCTPDILESSMWYRSREELLKDRLSLCEQLIGRFQFREPELQREIAALTRQLAILDLTSEIQRSRIFIDTDAILKNLDEATWSQTNSLLTVRALRSNELQRGLKLLRIPNPEGGKVTVVVVDEGKAFFETVFEKIKQQFLYSPELGLDANLSQRVRHGTLAGELRAIFDRLHLSTKTQSDGSYEPNRHWYESLGVVWNAWLAEKVNASFRAFSEGIDEQIRMVREDWIQIRSDAKPVGLFEYGFTDDEIDRLLRSISPLAEHADVHDLIVSSLLERTESCLSQVRSAIMTKLAPAIEQLLNQLVIDVDDAVGSGVTSVVSLRNVVTQCKTEFGRQLEKIQGWFYVDNRHEQKPFHFPALVGGVEEVLNRINSPCTVALLKASGSDVPIQGAYFRPLWDLLVILFDNASRHSGVDAVSIHLTAEFRADSTQIRCLNEMRENSDIGQLRAKAEQLNLLSLTNQSDLNKLREEGGSGTAKLHKIVRHELGRDRHDYRITFGVTAVNEFEVLITLQMGLTNAHPAD